MVRCWEANRLTDTKQIGLIGVDKTQANRQCMHRGSGDMAEDNKM